MNLYKLYMKLFTHYILLKTFNIPFPAFQQILYRKNELFYFPCDERLNWL